MKKCLLVILSFTLGACTQTYWDKPGVSPQEYARDSYECERDMRQSYFDENTEGSYARSNFEARCMVSKGYTRMERAI
ncbi:MULTISPECIES: hypothetical protein [unclassified Legionella]|uniref:hypothetical protein n=1 Tax=unclassified Legionella TaxID=2622702 RepID=UPI001E51D362|nr:hypothetical protein [Legionella sp. 31fI33]MCC5015769.1 hypothetical protein [Legionella sp. 31fI33]